MNGSAIEIARLSVWIKTAKRGQVLTDLDRNIVVANSIITDPVLDPRARDWDAIFPEVVRAGGFDVVVGNPPYVRAEQFVELKPHLESRFQTYHGQADLYVFFFELGLRLLRPGGRLAYIANNKWLKAGYGASLRRMLVEHTELEEVVDFGHAKQIFPDADTFPCVVVARKPTGEAAKPLTVRACTIPRDQFRIESLRQQIDDKGFDIPQGALGSTGWTLEPSGIENLMQKMRANSSTLRDVLGKEPAYGIKVGMSAAYLLTSEVRDRIVAAHPPCTQLFRPYLRGRDLKRWAPEWGGEWMLVLSSSADRRWPWTDAEPEKAETIFATTYPSVYRHLKLHETRLRARSDQGVYWWELRTCSYYSVFERPKIVMQRFAYHSRFGLDIKGHYLNDSAILLPSDDRWLLGCLNSPAFWYYAFRTLPHKKDEALAVDIDKVEDLPIPLGDRYRAEAAPAVERLMEITRERTEATRALLDWLRMEMRVTKPGRALAAPHRMTANDFVEEVRKRRPRTCELSSADLRRLRTEYDLVVLPLVEAWNQALGLERKVADAVHSAYGLSTTDVTLMWDTAPPRMPGTAGDEDEDAEEAA